MVELFNKDLVAKSFKSCVSTYEENATVQKEISNQLFCLMQRLDCIDFSRMLEIGCSTGVLTEMVCSRHNVNSIWLSDIVAEFCTMTGSRIKNNVANIKLLAGDIEKEKLPKDLTLVLSSSTFQWMVNFSRLIEEISNSLKSGGHLAFSIFGQGTMNEITALTGRGLPYLSEQELLAHLGKHLNVIHIHKENKRIYFPTVRAVLRHIQRTGVGGLGKHRWTVSGFKEFESSYVSRFGTDLGVPVSYISTFVVAEKR